MIGPIAATYAEIAMTTKVGRFRHGRITRLNLVNLLAAELKAAIFYADEKQKEEAAAFIKERDETKTFKNSIMTTLKPLPEFYAKDLFRLDAFVNHL